MKDIEQERQITCLTRFVRPLSMLSVILGLRKKSNREREEMRLREKKKSANKASMRRVKLKCPKYIFMKTSGLVMGIMFGSSVVHISRFNSHLSFAF